MLKSLISTLILLLSVTCFAGWGYIKYEYNLAGDVVCKKIVDVNDSNVETAMTAEACL